MVFWKKNINFGKKNVFCKNNNSLIAKLMFFLIYLKTKILIKKQKMIKISF